MIVIFLPEARKQTKKTKHKHSRTFSIHSYPRYCTDMFAYPVIHPPLPTLARGPSHFTLFNLHPLQALCLLHFFTDTSSQKALPFHYRSLAHHNTTRTTNSFAYTFDIYRPCTHQFELLFYISPRMLWFMVSGVRARAVAIRYVG